MRVLHVTRDFAPRNVGGVSSAVSGLVKALSDVGVAQAVVSFDAWRVMSAELRPHRLEQWGAVPVLRAESDIRPDTLADFVRAFAPTIQVVHDGLLFSHTPAYVRPRVQVVHVIAAAQDRLRGVARTLTSDAQRSTLALADRVVVATHAAKDLLAHEHPGIAAHVCGLASSLPVVARGEPGPIVLALRYDWLKGIDVVAEALPELVRRRPVVIAGGLPESPKTERRWARELAAAEQVGWLGPPALAALLSRAAVFVAPSRLETCGLAVLEAASAGAPLVVSDIAAHLEAVPDAETFASGDANALVAAVDRCLAAPHASQVQSWPERVHEWLAFFADCR